MTKLSSMSGGVPVGSFHRSVLPLDPAKYLPCDGVSTAETTSQKLIDKLGTNILRKTLLPAVPSAQFGAEAVASANNLIISNSANGGFFSRTPSSEWDYLSVPYPMTIPMRSIAWGNSMYVATSAYGVYTSTDGLTWVQIFMFLADSYVVFNGSVFVLIGSNSNACRTSADGITWTPAENALPNSNYRSSLIWNGAIFISLDSNYGDTAVTSPDGITWTQQTLPVAAPSFSSAWNGTVFCAIAQDSTTVITSPDGITWTQQTLPVWGSWVSMEWNGTVFCAIALNTDIAVTSPDGVNWTQQTLPFARTWSSIIWNGTVFCAIAHTDYMVTSPDGITWTQQALPITVRSALTSTDTGESFIFGYGLTDTQVMKSTDGITWSGSGQFVERTTSSYQTFRIAWNGTVYLAVQVSNPVVLTSSDGITWAMHDTSLSVQWTSVAWNGTVFCAIGMYSDIAVTSPDGITWTQQTLPVWGNWSSIAWNGTVFCAVLYSWSDSVATSPDGITWTQQTLPVWGYWYSIIWNGTVFCAVGQTTEPMTSPDGITWTQQTMPGGTANWLSAPSIAWNGTVFCIVVGGRGTFTSPDGITWTESPVPAWGFVNTVSICSVGTTFYVVLPYAKDSYESSDGITFKILASPITAPLYTSAETTGNPYYSMRIR